MKKLFQILFKNKKIIDNKLILCVVTLVITTLTIFVALNALPLLEESLKLDLRKTTVGESEYTVTHKDNELFQGLSNEGFEKLDILALDGTIEGEKDANINIWGANYNDFKKVFGNTYQERGEVDFPDSLNEDELLISPELSDKLNISNGSKVNINLYDQQIPVTVKIAPKDNFFVISNEDLAILNGDILYDELGLDNDLVSLSYLYSVDDGNIIDNLIDENGNLYIRESIDPEYISGNMSTYYGVEALILVFILLIASDIVKSTALIYVSERSKFIGTLRSNGAEKKSILKLFTKISLRIMQIGSIIGMILGFGLILVFASTAIGMENPFDSIDIIFLGISIVITLAIAVFLTTTSFRKPVKQLLLQSDRSLILDDVSKDMQYEVNKKHHIIYPILLIILIPLGFLVSEFNMYVILLYSIILIYILIKSIKVLFTAITTYIRRKTGKGTTLIAGKNVGSNIYLRKTLSLTSTISLFITIVGILIFSILFAMTSFYQDYKSDAFIRVDDELSFNEEEISQLESLPHITDTYKYYSGNVTINGEDSQRQVVVVGLDDPIEYDENFFNMQTTWLEGFEPSTFNEDKNAIISQVTSNRFGFELGEEIKLDDGDIEENYTIVGITPSLQELGDLTYISRYDSDFANGANYNGVYIRSTDTEALEEDAEDIFFDREFRYRDVSEMQENDVTNGMQVIIFFVAFAGLVALTSITGIYSNYKLSYIMRKKEFAVLYSSGYSKKHILKILVSEIIIISSIGYIIGFLVLLIVKKPLENLMELVELPISLNIRPEIFLAMFIVVAIMTLINIILAVKFSRISKDRVVEELKM